MHNGLSTKANRLLTKVQATTRWVTRWRGALLLLLLLLLLCIVSMWWPGDMMVKGWKVCVQVARFVSDAVFAKHSHHGCDLLHKCSSHKCLSGAVVIGAHICHQRLWVQFLLLQIIMVTSIQINFFCIIIISKGHCSDPDRIWSEYGRIWADSSRILLGSDWDWDPTVS